ncbi:OLC1v1000649C1 [Oldenlandia corymbosa var. corymbosa]|uniref:OLC1v1000649C1 n=1 Tax=Oldenlandia corymbosa var. corymbosa TaxID=529605 RepID=A0AAV1D6W6_OLDCO|nr:OLC1v1000649C1 [Oldenlandia corymbosa var. corymbosa]
MIILNEREVELESRAGIFVKKEDELDSGEMILDSKDNELYSAEEALARRENELVLKEKNLGEFEKEIGVFKGKVWNLCSELLSNDKFPYQCVEHSNSPNLTLFTNVKSSRKRFRDPILEFRGSCDASAECMDIHMDEKTCRSNSKQSCIHGKNNEQIKAHGSGDDTEDAGSVKHTCQ